MWGRAPGWKTVPAPGTDLHRLEARWVSMTKASPSNRCRPASAMSETGRRRTLGITAFAEQVARRRGILLADTKVEFGVVGDELVLADEVLTPDFLQVLAS